MLDHLMHFVTSPRPTKAYSPCSVKPEIQGVLTSPHSLIARGDSNNDYHRHDLVAISMGPGGWVLKCSFNGSSFMLEPKCHDCNVHIYTECECSISANHEHNLSQINELFAPKPAKLYKHIYIYIYILGIPERCGGTPGPKQRAKN